MDTSKRYFMFDPTQRKEFGLNFHQGEGFYYRYQSTTKLFWKARYIPLGPVCESKDGFLKFVEHIASLKMTKIKIDLPFIASDNDRKYVAETLEKSGFKRSEYIQDDETNLVYRDSPGLNSRNMRYVRQGLRSYDIEVTKELTDEEFKAVHDVYAYSANQIGFTPKSLEAFKSLREGMRVAVARSKSTGAIDGFLLGYLVETVDNSGAPYKILQLIFTGLNERGKNSKLGFALHNALFDYAFVQDTVHAIDFHGASRSKGRSYVGFKTMFGGEFVALPGSFERVRLL